jgi:AraC-like DNA-binding protein
MANSIYSFSEIDSSKAFTDLGQSLGGKSVNNIIHIPSENGNGVIRKLDFEPGLHIRVWDFNLSNAFCFHRIPDAESQAGKAFTILYILTPDAVVLNSVALKKDMKLQGPMSTLLISNDIDIHFDILPNHPVKALDITISAHWMKSQFSDADPSFLSFIDKMKEHPNPSVYVDHGNPVEYRTATDLHEQALEGAKGSLYLKAKTLSLVSEFFSRSFNNNPTELLEGNVLHQEKMLMVEKILEQHFEKDLPSIEALARKAALSESTLKRHFKMMFGKSIYEYYLEKKMEYAKRLLLEKPLTVKEVAYRLGYEKTSNFIHMFKKFHSYSPGHLKKNIAF